VVPRPLLPPLRAFTEAAHFAIHILRDDQLRWPAPSPITARPGTRHLAASPDGVPLIDDVLARFDCRLHAIHDGGDHAIVVGEVTAAVIGDGAPLVFAGGGYGGFAPF
jgi:flavin reductase (DIM6/NTAB) family NADH-FMN oxidoreductase RutF